MRELKISMKKLVVVICCVMWLRLDASNEFSTDLVADLKLASFLPKNVSAKEAKVARKITAVMKQRKREKETADKTFQGDDVQIIDVHITEFDDKGFSTLIAIKQLVMECCIDKTKAAQIEVKDGPKGNCTDKMYEVLFNNRPVFFMKIENRAYSEQENLIKLQKGYIGRLGIKTRYMHSQTSTLYKNLPIIVWLEKIFKYKDRQGNDCFLEMTHAARGIIIRDFLIKTENEETIKKYIYAMGLALGSFQQFFMNYVNPEDPNSWKTVQHRDLHLGNMLFDVKTSKIYFIDNGVMKDDEPIMIDIHRIFAVFKRFVDMRIKDWRDVFAAGYVESYPIEKKDMVKKYIESIVVS